MKSEWKKLKIGDVCTIKHGYAFKGIHFCDEKTEHIVTTPGNFAISGGFKLDKPKYYRGPVPQDYILSPGDIIVTMTDLSKDGDTLGYAAIVPESDNAIFLHNQRIGLIENISDSIDKGFLYWLMRTYHYQKYIVNHASGSTVKHTSPSSIASYNFQAPPLPIQRKIASILSALDDKIETNNAICRNLEEQAIALYKSRLIDSIPFERIEDSHEKTTGWRIGTVDDVVEFLDSRRVPLSKSQREKMEKKYPYYGATELMDYVDNYLFDGTFLLLGEDGTVQDENGYPILQYVWGKFWVNNHAHVLTGKGKWSIELLYLLFANTKVSSVVTGAVQPKISQNRLKTVPVVIPPNPILENLSALITPLFAKRRQLSDENHRLASMRDALIPKIMCGEIDLSTII